MVWAVAVPAMRGWSPVVIMSGSMGPKIDPGDIVLVAPYHGGPLAPGAIILFDNPSGPTTITHRITAVTPDRRYITQGDANPIPDSTPVDPATIHGTVRIVVPKAGLPTLWASTGQPTQLIATALIITALFWVAGFVIPDQPKQPTPLSPPSQCGGPDPEPPGQPGPSWLPDRSPSR